MFGISKQRTTAQHRARFRMLQDMGCVACLMEGDGYREPDVHHLLEGGVRIGHDATIPLCPWHHRGVPAQNGELLHGPSLAERPRSFVVKYGRDRELLDYVNRRLGLL